MNVNKHINRGAALIEAHLLPDRCTIETTGETYTRGPTGALTSNPVMRLYQGSVNIPCRLDNSRSFRPEKLPNQEINANEYVLHVPRTVEIKPNDKVRVVVDGKTHVFEIRKRTALSEWRVTNEALIVELEGQHA